MKSLDFYKKTYQVVEVYYTTYGYVRGARILVNGQVFFFGDVKPIISDSIERINDATIFRANSRRTRSRLTLREAYENIENFINDFINNNMLFAIEERAFIQNVVARIVEKSEYNEDSGKFETSADLFYTFSTDEYRTLQRFSNL